MIKKTIILLNIFLLLGILLGTILFTQSIKAVGQVPNNCVNLTNFNPKNTPYCNPSCSSHNCITYCRAGSSGAKFTVHQDVKDIIIKYKAPTRPIHIRVPGTSINTTVYNYTGQLKDISGKVFHKGDIITVIISDNEGYAIGFRLPSNNNLCGENNICREDGGKGGNPRYYEPFSIADLVNPPQGYHVLSKQCYGDSPIGDSDFDFNDYALVIFGKPVNGPTPTPTPTPSPTPIPPYLLICKDLVSYANTGKDGKSRMYDFICYVNKEANQCKLNIDGKVLKAVPNKDKKCYFEYTFKKSGDYNVTCYAVDTNNKYETTSNDCKTLIHIPEDSSGDYILPLLVAFVSSSLIAVATFKKRLKIKS